jgi:hypothetical protein
MKYGGITFTKISFAGIDIAFKNPDALLTAIWIAFFYFLYRYYLYFVEKGMPKFKLLTDDLDHKCQKNIDDLTKRHKRAFIKNTDQSEYPVITYSTLKNAKWVYHFVNDESRTGSQGYLMDNSGCTTIKPRWLLVPILSAWLNFFFRRSIITDYVLPFAAAIFIIWYCGSNDWHGSFLRLLF